MIVNVDKLTYAGNLENLKSVEADPRYHFVQADICDKEAVSKVFEEYEIDYVVNFAAESHVDRSIADPDIFVRPMYWVQSICSIWQNRHGKSETIRINRASNTFKSLRMRYMVPLARRGTLLKQLRLTRIRHTPPVRHLRTCS